MKNNFVECRDRYARKMNLIHSKATPTSFENLDQDDIMNNLDSTLLESVLCEKIDTMIHSWKSMFDSEDVIHDTIVLEEQRHSQRVVSLDIKENISQLSVGIIEGICKSSRTEKSSKNATTNAYWPKANSSSKSTNTFTSFLFRNGRKLNSLLYKKTILPLIFRKRREEEEEDSEYSSTGHHLPPKIDSIFDLQQSLPENCQTFCEGQEHVTYYLIRFVYFSYMN